MRILISSSILSSAAANTLERVVSPLSVVIWVSLFVFFSLSPHMKHCSRMLKPLVDALLSLHEGSDDS